MTASRVYHVEFYDRLTGVLEHNDTYDSIEDAFADAQGRVLICAAVDWVHKETAHMAYKQYDVTVSVEVTDADELIAAAREWLVDTGACEDMDMATEELPDDAIEMALRYLIDPGTNVPGVQVLDSQAALS